MFECAFIHLKTIKGSQSIHIFIWKYKHCKSGNFYGPFISHIIYFQIISEFLNLREGTCVFLKPNVSILLVRTLNSLLIELGNIKFSQTFPYKVTS